MIGHDFNTHNFYIDFIFLPSGLRVLGFMIWREKVIPGLFLGAFLTNLVYHPDLMIHDSLFISAASACSGPLACYIFEYLTQKKLLTELIRFTHLMSLSLIYAFINALIHFMEFELIGFPVQLTFKHFIEMLVGDINGIILLILLIKIFIYLLKKFYKRPSL